MVARLVLRTCVFILFTASSLLALASRARASEAGPACAARGIAAGELRPRGLEALAHTDGAR